ncbi:MAG: hypothetical protein AAFX65_12960 [Cyanobacteria bacterium J06638_7]
MPRFQPPSCTLIALAAAAGLGSAVLPGAARAETLYSLTTTCSFAGAAPAPCVVEAVEVGEATEYRHTVGERTITYRVFDDPFVRIEGRNPDTGSWSPARNALIRFSTNELCFNNGALCVVNPNFLNSVREDAGTSLTGRDLMALGFGEDGRVDVTCFDDGCLRLQEAIDR